MYALQKLVVHAAQHTTTFPTIPLAEIPNAPYPLLGYVSVTTRFGGRTLAAALIAVNTNIGKKGAGGSGAAVGTDVVLGGAALVVGGAALVVGWPVVGDPVDGADVESAPVEGAAEVGDAVGGTLEAAEGATVEAGFNVVIGTAVVVGAALLG